MVATRLEAGRPINASFCDGFAKCTPLQAAVKTRRPPFVQLLLNHGADPNFIPDYSSTCIAHFSSLPPLHRAIHLEDREIVIMLLQAGANINSPFAKAGGYSALSLAVKSKNQQLFHLIIAKGAAKIDSEALLEAVKQGNVPLVKDLLEPISISGQKCCGTFGQEALCEAVRERSVDLVNLLLSAGISPNTQPREETALGLAVMHHDHKRMLQDKCADIIKMLFQKGADPNGLVIHQKYGRSAKTPLVTAAMTGDISLVNLLIEHGADSNAYPTDAVWRSPLQAACEAGKFRVVQLLLSHNVDFNAPPAWYNGGAALQLAAINGHPGIVHALLDRGADLNAPAARVNGRAALEGAAEHGRLDTVRMLLDAGVRIDGPYEAQYNRALELAEKNGHRPVYRELLARAEEV